MSFPKCELQQFPCVDVSYSNFDDICKREIRGSINGDLIVNHSTFCTEVPINEAFIIEHLETSDYLKSLRGKLGIYHLWVDYDNCEDHNKYTMLCVYVGKGMAEQRILCHIKDKWPKSTSLYVSFHECENRIAKYLEQLFLDTYSFHLNKAENRGLNYLYAVWDDERHLFGTEINNVSNIYSARTEQLGGKTLIPVA